MNEAGNVKYKVMVVDDSSLIRGYLQKVLEKDPQIEVCGTAENGKIAVDKINEYNPDVILLDVEMPEMDGLSALPLLIKEKPDVKIIMVSTLTSNNAAKSIEAMSKGAADYIEKPTADTDKIEFKNILLSKIKAIASAAMAVSNSIRKSHEKLDDEFNFLKPEGKLTLSAEFQKIKPASSPENVSEEAEPASDTVAITIEQNNEHAKRDVEEIKPAQGNFNDFEPSILAIGSSTGGPPVLNEIFGQIGDSLSHISIFITQHMPPQFTTFLAKNIAEISGANCLEAQDGQKISKGEIYVAPGDYHMLIESDGAEKKIKLTKDDPENFCRPAVDPMLRSLVEAYGAKNILTVILTGMGQDGMLGAKVVHDKGGKVIIQDQQSSVVWGMPGAIAKEGFQDAVYSKDEMAQKIINLFKRGL